MSSKTNRLVMALCLAVPLAGLSAGCAKSKQKSETAQRAQQIGGSAMTASSMTATVEDVDRANRTVTLRESDGEVFTVNVSDNAPIERIEPNDTVNIAYQGVLTFDLKEPGSAPRGQAALSAKQLPSGVQYVHQAETTVQILSVAEGGRSVTFRDQEGEVRTVAVMDPQNQAKVAQLRPGDSVDVAFTEQLDIQLEE